MSNEITHKDEWRPKDINKEGSGQSGISQKIPVIEVEKTKIKAQEISFNPVDDILQAAAEEAILKVNFYGTKGL